MIKEDTYVDDIATGADTVEAADVLMQNVELILKNGKFNLKGYILSGDTSKEKVELVGSGDVGRVLGVRWCPGTDEICVTVKVFLAKKKKGVSRTEDINKEQILAMVSEISTRRIILSVTNISSVFSFRSPFP